MLMGLTDFKTFQVVSSDGEIGRFVDVVFPRGQWSVRYMVAWHNELGREIVLPAAGIVGVHHKDHLIHIDAGQDRIEASPDLDVGRRIERHEEQQLYEHYGWPPYWLQEEHDVTPTGLLSGEREEIGSADEREFAGAQMQQAAELLGVYAVHSNEGQFGMLQDLIIDGATWRITRLVVDAPVRREGVLVETDEVERIDWIAKEIYISGKGDQV